MKGVWIGSLLSAVVLFVWGFLYWGVLPVSSNIFDPVPESLVQELRALPSTGTYMVPDVDLYETDEAAFQQQHEAGPIAMLFVRKEGTPAGSPITMGKGFVHMFLSALLMAFVLRTVAGGVPQYTSRVLFVLIAGSAGSFMADIGPIIWWLQPPQMHVANFVYHVVGWGFIGLILARFIRPATT